MPCIPYFKDDLSCTAVCEVMKETLVVVDFENAKRNFEEITEKFKPLKNMKGFCCCFVFLFWQGNCIVSVFKSDSSVDNILSCKAFIGRRREKRNLVGLGEHKKKYFSSYSG